MMQYIEAMIRRLEDDLGNFVQFINIFGVAQINLRKRMNTRKIIRFSTVILSLFLNILLVSNNWAQAPPLKYIEAKCTVGNINTILSISCSDFDSAFTSTEVKEKRIISGDILEAFGRALQSVKYQKGEPQIDVRSKFYFYFIDDDKAPIVICADKFFDLEMNGRRIRSSKRLIYLLRKVQDLTVL